MKSSKYSLIMMFLLSLSSFSIDIVDSKEESGAESPLSRELKTCPEKRFVACVESDGVQRVEVVGDTYFYDPNYIVVKVNKPVELKVKKTAGYIPHNIIAKAPEAGIDFKLELKEEAQTIDFTPVKVGTYQIYCDKSMFWFKSQREKGMEGLIEVIE